MDIHNLTEDFVFKYINEILELKKDICKCEQCINDIACYALNRVKPMYVISSRGIIHTENQKRYHFQDTIDIYTTVSEAIDVVSKTGRHDSNEKIININDNEQELTNNPESDFYFNFPQMVGRILESKTLSPITGAVITLSDEKNENKIKMFNDNWSNPVEMVPQMEGTYTFWPAPVSADKAGLQKDFNMTLRIKKDGYEMVCKFFYVRLVSENRIKKYITKDDIYYLDDTIIIEGKRKGGR